MIQPLNYYGLLAFLSLLTISCQGQNQTQKTKMVGGGCEGCEALFEYGEKQLTPVDTLPDFDQTEPKLKITGTVYQIDGKTPASGVILYIHHTNRKGIYPQKGDEIGWGKRHGYLRGWIQTDASGSYTFYTFRPAAYPDGTEPEHIHLTVKESGINAYYLDDFLFADDPGLSPTKVKNLSHRGGNGVVSPVLENGILQVKRNLILGLNIPDYE